MYGNHAGNEFHESWSARLSFALEMFVKMPNDTRIAMILYSIKYTLKYGPNVLLRSLLPSFFLGAGPADTPYKLFPDAIGDVSAKTEARTMMRSFVPTAKVTYNRKEEEVVEEKELASAAPYPAPFN